MTKKKERHTVLIDSLAAKLFPFQESEFEQESFTDTGRERVDEWIDEVLAPKAGPTCPLCKKPSPAKDAYCEGCQRMVLRKVRPAEVVSS